DEEDRREAASRFGEGRVEQAAVRRGVKPERAPGDAVGRHRDAVRDTGGAGALALTDCFAEDARRVGDKDDGEEKEEVEEDESAVDALDAAADRVVIQPHYPDYDEADGVGGEGRPAVGEF